MQMQRPRQQRKLLQEKLKHSERGAIENAEQAKRDALIFKKEVLGEVGRILEAKVREDLKGEALGKLIKAVVNGEDMSQYAAEVAEVTDELKAALADKSRMALRSRLKGNCFRIQACRKGRFRLLRLHR